MPLNESQRTAEAAELLIEARSSHRPIPRLPQEIQPRSFAEAYAIQAMVTRSLGAVGGWKIISLKSEPHVAAAPLHSELIQHSGARFKNSEFHNPLVEVEIAFAAKQLIPAQEIRTAVHEPMKFFRPLLLLEILSSRFLDAFATPALDLLADNYACGAIVLGGASGRWDGKAGHRELRVANGGTESTHDIPASAMDAAAFTLRGLAELTPVTGGLRSGQVVTTGALTPPFAPEGVIEAKLGPLGQVRATFTP